MHFLLILHIKCPIPSTNSLFDSLLIQSLGSFVMKIRRFCFSDLIINNHVTQRGYPFLYFSCQYLHYHTLKCVRACMVYRDTPRTTPEIYSQSNNNYSAWPDKYEHFIFNNLLFFSSSFLAPKGGGGGRPNLDPRLVLRTRPPNLKLIRRVHNRLLPIPCARSKSVLLSDL